MEKQKFDKNSGYKLKYKTVQMSQVDNACTRKTCLCHVYHTSVCNQHILSS